MSIDAALSAKLLAAARAARAGSHAPYSGIHVGAAVLTEAGDIVSGANVENASYGLTTCAERIAIFTAVTNHGAKRFQAVAVSVFGDLGDKRLEANEVSPCGACRQVMAEFMADDAPIIVDGSKTYALGELLPDAFRIK
jgi:homotetrameric cytidine deaminase